MSRGEHRCTSRPFTRPITSSADGSRPVTRNGPSGAKVSEALARHHVRSFFCQTRALTSLPHVYPNTHAAASAGEAPRQGRPMTATSSASSSTLPASGGSTMDAPGAMTHEGSLRNTCGSFGASRPLRWSA